MVVIVNYANQDLRGLVEVIASQGHIVEISHQVATIETSDYLILPNSDSYQETMSCLRDLKLVSVIKKLAQKGKPILGIGLGMHLLFEGTTEGGFIPGLEVLEGLSESLPNEPDFPLPHVGEELLIGLDSGNPLTVGLANQPVSYQHALTVDCELEQIKALSQYSLKFPAIIQEGSVVGFQFLPELSQGGQQALNNFLTM